MSTIALTCGCGQPAPVAPDVELAKQSLERFLSSWKSGGKPQDLSQSKPPIFVGEPDWESGNSCVAYLVLEDKIRDDGVNAHVSVELQMQDGRNRRPKAIATYIVSTVPHITIQRLIQ